MLTNKNNWQTTQIGYNIESYSNENFPDLRYAKLALFNVSEYEGSKNNGFPYGCLVRKNLYSLHSKVLPKICDLGYMILDKSRKENFNNIINVCFSLLDNGTLPILIGGGHDISYAMYKSHTKFKRDISYTCLDNKFDIGTAESKLSNSSHLSKIIKAKPNFLHNYTNIGYQSYFVSPHATEMLESMKFSYYRLGEVKEKLANMEPIFRDTDMLTVDISVISSFYAGANKYSSPNGLDGSEICKLLFYAGVSDKLKSLGFFEYNQKLDNQENTAKLISQSIWYFMYGFSQRIGEEVPSQKNLITYNVTLENEKYSMVFCKSKISERWWIVVPKNHKFNKTKIDKFFACCYDDYKKAMKGDIPDAWIRIIKFLN